MKCHICDSSLTNIHFNRLHGDIDPCPKCLEIIRNVFGEEGDPEEIEDSAEIEPTIEEMMEDVEELAYGRSFE